MEKELYNPASLGAKTLGVQADAEKCDRFSTRVRFILYDGTVLSPVRVKNRQTGKVAFLLSEGGAGGNTRENAIEVVDEDEMAKMVCFQGLAVRASSLNRERNGLYRKGKRSVRIVELDGTVV